MAALEVTMPWRQSPWLWSFFSVSHLTDETKSPLGKHAGWSGMASDTYYIYVDRERESPFKVRYGP